MSVEYLIISESGRALAASAKNAGYEVSVIDRYADRDTVALSRSIHRYEGLHLADFLNDIESYSYLQKLIKYSVKSGSNITAIIGSGFEKRPEQIEIIRKYMPIISNSVKTINLAKDPMKLGKLLAKKSINYPFSTINKNDFCSEKEFLIKELGAMGGGHVSVNSNSLLRKTLFDKKYYYQEYIKGTVCSAVFLANEKTAQLIGINELIKPTQFLTKPFLYEGAVTVNLQDKKFSDEIYRIITEVTKLSKLSGLCGIDFIINKSGIIYIIDINPRPPATFELYEDEGHLFQNHLDCFQGRLPEYMPHNLNKLKGHAIYYAKKDIIAHSLPSFPDWVSDIPAPKKSKNNLEMKYEILAENPVCTIYAEGVSIKEVKNLLNQRLNEIELSIKSINKL